MAKMIRKFEIYFADLTPVVGSEQGGVRPVLVLQNDVGNRHSPTTIVCVITSKKNKAEIPTHIVLGKNFGLTQDSIAMFEQIKTIDKARLRERIGMVDDPEIIAAVDRAIHISLGLRH